MSTEETEKDDATVSDQVDALATRHHVEIWRTKGQIRIVDKDNDVLHPRGAVNNQREALAFLYGISAGRASVLDH